MLTIWKTVSLEAVAVLEVHATETTETLAGPVTLDRVFTLRPDRAPDLFANPGWTNDDLCAALAGYLGLAPGLVTMTPVTVATPPDQEVPTP